MAHSSLPDRLGSLVINRYDTSAVRGLPKQPYLAFSTVPLKNTHAALTGVASVLVSGPQTVAANVQHKDSYNLAGLRVLSYRRMQTLLTLLQATTFYEAAVTRRARIIDISGSLKPQPGNHPRTFLLPETANQQPSLRIRR